MGPTRVLSPARPAFYALRDGGWRDYVTLLHPPYTAWHLSYVVIGACLAPRLDLARLAWSLAAFALAVGVASHCFDELQGRPLGTRIPRGALIGLGVTALAGAVVIGAYGVGRLGAGFALVVLAGGLAVPAYTLEWFRGRLHSDASFAAFWGGFPVVCGYYAQAGTLRTGAILAALAACAISLAQRCLSTWVRDVRRRAVRVDGTIVWRHRDADALSPALLIAAAERALLYATLGVVLLAAGLLVTRL